MISALTAYTAEIDEIEIAVAEICGQLGLPNNLLRHSAGIITCYPEFIQSGVVKALCDRLPFPVVGTTTLASSVEGECGQLILSIIVLTSDDATFEAAVTSSLAGDLDSSLRRVYSEAAGRLGQEPGLIFTMAPLIYHYAGDQYVEAFDRITGGIPCFGTICIGQSTDYSDCFTICNGEVFKEEMAVLLVGGEPDPTFFVVSIAANKIQKRAAIITKAEGNILKEVNDMPLAKYLETLGLASGGSIAEGVNTVPFVIDYNDGTQPIARALFAITPEGFGVCGGVMPVGSLLSIGGLSRDDVVDTTAETTEAAMATGKKGAMLIFSCIGRNLALGMDTMAELECVKSRLSGNIPFLMGYSGGEICPVVSERGYSNRFHNNTFIACII